LSASFLSDNITHLTAPYSWEYPNGVGIGCNVGSSSDVANFLLFLQALRQDPVGKGITMSAAVSIKPWMGADGNPSTDVSGFAAVLDYIGQC
jgi:chitinase